MILSGKKNKAVLGIFKTRSEVDSAVEALKADGFSTTDISVLMPEQSYGAGQVGLNKASKAPEGAATGATAGAALGATAGILAGVGALVIPGFGPIIAVGPIMAALAGAGAGGIIGGIGGALIGLGIPEIEAKRYEDIMKKGGILVSVHADNSAEVDKAQACLERAGAEDVAATGEAKTDWHLFPKKGRAAESKRF